MWLVFEAFIYNLNYQLFIINYQICRRPTDHREVINLNF